MAMRSVKAICISFIGQYYNPREEIDYTSMQCIRNENNDLI